MHAMDTDASGTIKLSEFEAWWRKNGGDLEKHRELALTVRVSDVQLLLVAADAETKRVWVSGLRAVLRRHSKVPR